MEDVINSAKQMGVKFEEFTEEEAVDWIDYNTIRALHYMGSQAPIVMYPIE